MTVSPVVPLLDGSLTILPGFLDFHVHHNPQLPYLVLPSPESPVGHRDITFQELADATHRVAHILRPERKGAEGEVVAVVINADSLLYVALLAGMIRAGLVPFPMSSRNSPQAIRSMLEKTGCHRMVSQSSLSPLVSELQTELKTISHELEVVELPPLPEVFPGFNGGENVVIDVQTYPPSPTKPQSSDLVIYIHSSGSTGYPKPIPHTQRSLLQACRGNSMMGAVVRRVRYGAMAPPTFHMMGFLTHVLYPVVSGCPTALFAPQWPAPPVIPHVRNTLETARLTRCNALISVPSFLEAWAHDLPSIEYLKTLSMVVFGGGPLSKTAGDTLAEAGVKIVIAYGGTEFGGPTVSYPEDKPMDAPVEVDSDWEWMRFSKRVNVRWDPQGDGTYELQVLTSENYAPVIENLPDVRGYATSDLFIPHPTRQGLWKIVGRKDDVIVLGTGEKIVPLQQEENMTANPMVMGALMFGREREQPGLIVEPHPEYAIDPEDETALAEFRNRLWPSVEKANAPAPAFARIFKEMILVTKPNKPLPRAGKGTIIRKQAMDLYAPEISILYDAVTSSADTKGIAPPKSWSVEHLEDWLTDHAASVNGGRVPLPTTPLFDQGFDSLSATFMRNRIVGSLRNTGDPELQKAAAAVSQNFVFEYPTIHQLASAIAALVDPSTGTMDLHKDRAQEVEELVQKYTASLPVRRGRQTNSGNDQIVVLLTGSTGNIGSHILAALLGDKRIAKVYTLNRPSASGGDRLATAFSDRNLPVKLLAQSKLSSVTGDLCAENFGLPPTIYEEIKQSVTHIIHNAWTVNFNHPLSAFESQIAGVRGLLDIIASLNQSVHLLFTSSVGAASGWDPLNGPVPERPLEDPHVGVGTGYAASKYVVEQILAKASEGGLNLMSLRMGQACGAKSTGAWGTTEWVPIMVKSSVALGCLPKMDGPISWVPLDAIGNMYLDLLTSREPLPQVINVVHPRPTTWREVLNGIWEELGGRLPFVSLQEWVARLDALPAEVSSDELVRIPALKLRPFFRGMANADKHRQGVVDNMEGGESGGGPLYETTELQRCSPTMRRIPPMDKYHSRMWVKYWMARKFI